jgi:hypothetical protein
MHLSLFVVKPTGAHVELQQQQQPRQAGKNGVLLSFVALTPKQLA